MTQKLQIKLVHTPEALQLHFSGEHAKHVDGRVLQTCLNTILKCAETNGCFEHGMQLSAKCVAAIGACNEEQGCIAKGFGLSVPHEASTGLRASLVQEKIQFDITGERAKHIDAGLLESCINAVLACGCLNEGQHFSEKCIQTLASHNAACGCISKGFGLSKALARG